MAIELTDEEARLADKAARERRKRREQRGVVAHLVAAGVRMGAMPIGWLPAPLACFLARRLAEVVWWLLPSRARIATDNIELAFGDRFSARDRRRIGRESLRRFAMTLVEGVLLPKWIRTGKLAQVCDYAPGSRGAIERHHRGEPIIFFTAHFGPWEVVVRHMVRDGWRIGVPYRPAKNAWIQDWIVRTRGIEGPEQFPRKGALRPMLRLLREGAAVTMFLDQNDRHGIFVDFFGRPAATVPTVGALAERTGAAVYLQVPQRIEAGRRYRIRIVGPITIPEGGTLEERIHAWTQTCTRQIEACIRENPSDWFWVHRRWRTRPPVAREEAEERVAPE